MSQTEDDAIEKITKYARSKGGPLQEWYVGMAKDPKKALFKRHNVDKNKDAWFFKFVTDAMEAKAGVTPVTGDVFPQHCVPYAARSDQGQKYASGPAGRLDYQQDEHPSHEYLIGFGLQSNPLHARRTDQSARCRSTANMQKTYMQANSFDARARTSSPSEYHLELALRALILLLV